MDRLKALFGSAKETAGDLAEKAQPHVEGEKAKEVADDLAERAQPHMERAKDAAAETFEKGTEMTSGGKEAPGEATPRARHAADMAEDTDEATDMAKHSPDMAGDAMEGSGEEAGDVAEEAGREITE